MTDRELLMILYGALKSIKQMQDSDLLRLVEDHLFKKKQNPSS